MFLKRKLKKARKMFNEINETTLEIEKELLKIKNILSICQK